MTLGKRFIVKVGLAGSRLFVGLLAGLALGGAAISSRVLAAQGDPPRAPSIFDDDFPSSPTPARQTPQPDPSHPNPEHPAPDPAPPAPAPDVRPDAPSAEPDDGRSVLPGLVAGLFNGPDFGAVKMAQITRRVRATLDMSGGSGPFVPLSFRWTGLINIPAGGTTAQFELRSHGVGEVRIDGAVVSKGGGDTGKSEGQPVKLTEGVHPLSIAVSRIRLGTAKETILLYWAPEGEEMQPVPSAVLCHYKKDEPAGAKPIPAIAPEKGVASPSPARSADPRTMPKPPTPPRPAVVQTPGGTVAPPSEAQWVDLRKGIRTKLATLYADASSAGRQSLARKLIDAADSSTDDAERYALLREAADASAMSGDLKTALACDDTIGAKYKVNLAELKLAALTAASHGPRAVAQSHELASQAMAVSDQANDDGDFETASKAAQVAQIAFGVSTDEEAIRAKARVKELREIQAQFSHIAPLMKKLADSPDDPELNLKAGRFFCFTAGRWDKGLAYLSKGSDAALKALAEQEAAAPADGPAQLKLGDGWWDKSAGETSAAAAKCRERATMWYERVRAASKEELPDRILLRLATLSRNLELMDKVDVSDTQSWKREKGNLVCDGFSTLTLPYQPVAEYDFVVDYTPVQGGGSLTQLMPVRGSYVEWDVRGTYTNFQNLALRPGSFGPILKGRIPIIAGHRYTSVVQVRRSGVRGLINNTLIREWATDYTELGGGFFGSKPSDTRSLAIQCGGGEIIIHDIKVIEVGRGGR